MDRVLAAVDAQSSIAAKLRHRVEVIDRPPLIGTGYYLQQGRGAGRSYRLDLELRTSLFATHVQHVSDGNRLWMFEEFDGNRHLSLVDVARLAHAQPKVAAPGTTPTAPRTDVFALGGLPRMLKSFEQNFEFDKVQESRLDDLAVWSIEGTWNQARLAQLLPNQAEQIAAGDPANLQPLAETLPHRLVLHVGCDDLFPYRIEYWRTDVGENENDPADDRQQLMVVMELYEVQFGAQIDPARFHFRPPPDLEPADRTREFLERFGLEDPPPEEAKRRRRLRL